MYERTKRKAKEAHDYGTLVKTRNVCENVEKQKDKCFSVVNQLQQIIYTRCPRFNLTSGSDSVPRCLLQDKTLLSKLAEGDMIATDSVYQNKCLQHLYYRADKAEQSQKEADLEETLKSIVFAELVSFIEESGRDENTAPIFQMASLYKIYYCRHVCIHLE